MKKIKLLKPLTLISAFSLLAACGQKEEVKTETEAEAAVETVVEAEVAKTDEVNLTMETADEKISYVIGYQMASRYTQDPILAFDADLLKKGIEDALSGAQSLVSDADAQTASAELQGRVQAQQDEASAEAKSEGIAFLESNKAKEGIVVTDSGLQYEVLTKGESDKSPLATDTVKVHYHGTLTNGTVFDSSVDRGEPISFPLNGVIAGWTEGLQLMAIGDKFRFYIPSDLAYGGRATGSIPPHSTLIFDVELLGINEG